MTKDIKLIAGQTAPNQPRKSLYKQTGRVYSIEGIAPTLTTESDKNAHIICGERELREKIIHTIAYSKSHRKDHIDTRGKVDDEANTLSTGDGCTSQSTGNYIVEVEVEDPRILNPKMRDYRLNEVSPTITASSYKEPPVVLDLEDVKVTPEQEDRILKLASVSNKERKEHVKAGTVPDVEINVKEGECVATRHLGRNGKLTSEVSSTLQVAETPHIISPEVRIRKITPLEAERLMGWPDSWTRYGVDEQGKQYELSKSARYKACGNGIVPDIPEDLLNLVTRDELGLRVFSTFSGVDGSGLNLHKPKYTKVGFCEYEPKTKVQHAANVLRYHYPDVPNFGDITKVKVKDIPDHDIIFISAPCQSFSSAGNNMGIEDTRGTLFYETARIMQAKQPRFFIFENVKNLLSKKHERTFEIMCEVYSSLGYELDFEIINAKHYGVAQSRERVFMVGRLK